MTYYVYRVEEIRDGYDNSANTIDHDYNKDFEKLARERGYVNEDYFIDDAELEVGKVYFSCPSGHLIKIVRKEAQFEGEPFNTKLYK